MSSSTPGYVSRSLFLDSIEEAKALNGKRPVRHRRTIEDLAVRYLQQNEHLVRQLRKHIRKAVRLDPDWLPDAEFIKNMDSVGAALVRTWKEIRTAREAEQSSLQGLTQEQLDDVLTTHLIRLGTSIKPEHKRTLLAQWFGGDAADRLLSIPVPAAAGKERE